MDYYEATNKSDMDLIWKMGLADCKANQNVKFIFEFETSGTPGSLINYVLDQINSSDKKKCVLETYTETKSVSRTGTGKNKVNDPSLYLKLFRILKPVATTQQS